MELRRMACAEQHAPTETALRGSPADSIVREEFARRRRERNGDDVIGLIGDRLLGKRIIGANPSMRGEDAK